MHSLGSACADLLSWSLLRGRPEPGRWPCTQILWDRPYGLLRRLASAAGVSSTACFMQLSTPLNTALFSVQKSSQLSVSSMRNAREQPVHAPWTPSTDWLSRCCEPWKRDRSSSTHSSTQLPRVAWCCEPHVVTAAQKFGVESLCEMGCTVPT